MSEWFSLDLGDGVQAIAYFTPSAILLAQAFGAKPESEGRSLIVGDARAWDTHFPSRKANHKV
jgi:hypothetical protein